MKKGRKEADTVEKLTEATTPKQARSLATRTELIEAARRIFARDGFEHARLEDIAKAAGKTRGAFYDHFQDKEDIFFAIFEVQIAKKKAHLRKQVNSATTVEAKREILIDHMTALLRDREDRLLGVEFKLYAIRQPLRQKRLADLHAEMCFQGAERMEGLYPEFLEGTKAKRRAQSLKVGSLIDGLALNQMFDPGTMSQQAARAMVAAELDEILGPVRPKRG